MGEDSLKEPLQAVKKVERDRGPLLCLHEPACKFYFELHKREAMLVKESSSIDPAE